MTKTLVLIRHAHRDTGDPTADNGLSVKGRAQAKAVKRFYKERFGKERALLLSSPKKRCLETLGPLAERLGKGIKPDSRLLEQKTFESPDAWSSRLKAFMEWWRREAPRRVLACSHGDWIPDFLKRSIGAPIPLEKAGWAELVLEEGKARLECLLQTLPSK